MGTLTRFDLGIYDCDVFFETGTGTGASLAYAIENGRFKKLYSVEVYPKTAEEARFRFQHYPNVEIINSDSTSALLDYLPRVDPASRVLFFLDAHFPGEVDKDFRGYKSTEPKGIKLPLAEELQVIKQCRPNAADVIIIDDLRIYENGPFEGGNMPDWAETLLPHEKNINFVRQTFQERQVRKYYWNEGYIVISARKPKLRLKRSERPLWQLTGRASRRIRKLLSQSR